MMTFGELKCQVREWQMKNFPDSTDREPLEGIFEEIGELARAQMALRGAIRGFGDTKEAREDEEDAIADIIIFLADYSNKRAIGFTRALSVTGIEAHDFVGLQTDAAFVADEHSPFLCVVSWAGNLAHARLKMRQGIRGSTQDHETGEIFAVGMILRNLARLATSRGYGLQGLVESTWAKVKQRDWTKNKVTADEPGYAPVRSTMPYDN